MGLASGSDAFKYSGDVPRNDPAWRVVIAPGPSRRTQAWVMAVMATALVAILAAALPPWLQAVLAVALAALSIHALRRHGYQEGPGSLRRLAVDLAGGVEIDHRDGSQARGTLLDGCFVAPWLVIVRWRPEGRRIARNLFIAPDAAGGDELRRLRILLRWRA
jgi:toxin CptA